MQGPVPPVPGRSWLKRFLIVVGGLVAVAIAWGLGQRFLPEPTEQDYIARARVYERKGDLASAVAELKKALTLAPDNVDVRWWLSGIYLRQGAGEAARTELTRVQQLGRKGKETDLRLVLALLFEGEFEQALARLAFVESEPGDPTPSLLRGRARLGLGRVEAAREAFQEAVRLAPDHAETHVGLASALFALKQLEKAESAVDLGIQLAPDNVMGWLLKADIAMARSAPAGAQAALERVLELDRGNVRARLTLAHVLVLQGKGDQAKGYIEAVLGTAGEVR